MTAEQQRSTEPGAGRGASRGNWATRVLILYGALVVLASGVSALRDPTEPSGLTFSLLHLSVILGLAWGLVRFRRWAWWLGLIFAGLEILLLLPLAVSVVLGRAPPVDRDLTDAALWSLGAALLLVFVGLLFQARDAFRGRS